MYEEFEIPVVYNNQQFYFKARLLQLGPYTPKIQVDVNGTEVLVEPNEEGLTEHILILRIRKHLISLTFIF